MLILRSKELSRVRLTCPTFLVPLELIATGIHPWTHENRYQPSITARSMGVALVRSLCIFRRRYQGDLPCVRTLLISPRPNTECPAGDAHLMRVSTVSRGSMAILAFMRVRGQGYIMAISLPFWTCFGMLFGERPSYSR